MVAWGGSQDTRAAGCCTGASRDRSSGVIACGGTARIGTAVWGDCLGGQPSSEGQHVPLANGVESIDLGSI